MDFQDEIDRQNIINEIQKGTYIKAVREMYVKLYKEREYYKLQQNDSLHLPLQKVYNEVIELRKVKNSKSINTEYLFITINPDENISELDKFVRALDTISKKKWVEDCLYVIEQRGMNEDEIGKGYHAHLILHRNGKSFSKVARELLNTLYSHKIYDKNKIEEYVEKGNENGIIPYTTGPFVIEYTEPEHIGNRISYITGKKLVKNKDGTYNYKDIKQKFDTPFRAQNNLKEYYNIGEVFKPYIKGGSEATPLWGNTHPVLAHASDDSESDE